MLTIGWGYKRRWIGWFAIPVANIFIRDLQYTNFLSLSDKESVNKNPAVTVHTLGKKGEIKTRLFLKLLGLLMEPKSAKCLW